MKILVALASVAALALSAAPAVAQHHDRNGNNQTRSYHHGRNNGGRSYNHQRSYSHQRYSHQRSYNHQRSYGHERSYAHSRHGMHHQRYRVGYRFTPNYSYTAYDALPRTYVSRYHLSPRYRYVYSNGYIYVVDPTTWAVMRILNAF